MMIFGNEKVPQQHAVPDKFNTDFLVFINVLSCNC